ncbi:GIY-YIG nuclease family protein [Magnetospirillum sp. UT-4]|uniref:GIY-YIG nuclease family protein n=1 Tax=Magnetospirillum sp. UT-4 TaxID=2681467 RepID=UPI0020C374FE|nr:GIY-YIG nuclease family protein [Magnetospirillum sp. UT-4]
MPAKAGIHSGGRAAMSAMTRRPCVYILANRRNGTLYIGVTSDVIRRIWEHKTDAVEGFTKTYGVHMLVYYEMHETMPDAILREKQMKKWNRAWKIEMIQRFNPQWRDLYDDII